LTSRRRSKTVRSLVAGACLATLVTGGVASATTPPDTEPAGTDTEPAGTDTEPAGTDAAGGEGDVGDVGGSGCGIPHGPYEEPAAEPAGEVRVAWNDPLLSFNEQSSRGNATANNNVVYLMGRGNGGGFWYYDQDLNLINNDQFGTCTIESLDPLTVTYRINEGVTWSDGVPIDAADLVLMWAARSTVYNDAQTVVTDDGATAEADAEGNPIAVGPDGTETADPAEYDADEDFALDEGFTWKESTGVAFDAADESLQLVTQFPEVSEDGQAVTITWDSFYVDYQVGGLLVGVPAHVVAQRALDIEDPMEAKAALIAAFESDDSEAVKPISEFWNTGFDATALPDDPGIYLSAGPYVLTAYEELSQMTLEVNPDYDWGPKPLAATIVYTIIGDPTAAVQALENEEIDVIQPQATADILTQLEALADRGVEVLADDGATYEHVDLVFDNGGPFDPATYGGDEEIAHMVRQAFLKSIPRGEILERLITPLNPEATVRDSFTVVPGAPAYDEMIAENGSDAYAEVDIDGAVALLEEAGVETPIDVRFHFADNNPRRANQYELIRDSAAQAGFNVLDGRSPTWGQDLSNISIYDASMFGWQSTTVDVAGTEANFVTAGQNNFGLYSSETVDGLYEELTATTDPDEQQALLVQIEQQLWADAFGIPIYQHPQITGYNSTYVSGISNIAIAPTVFWNFWEWQPA
jgi:peptide/nickel transport system substrate-binding protein